MGNWTLQQATTKVKFMLRSLNPQFYQDSSGPARWEPWPLQSETVRYTLWYRYNERMVVHTRLMETGDIEQLPELTLPQVSLLRMALQ